MRATTLRVSAGAIFFLLALALYTGAAHAVPSYLTDFTNTYPNSATSSASCAVCHLTSSGSPSSPRNVYGAAWSSNGHNFVNVQALNSDGVAGTNLAEITAGAQPGWCVQTTTGCLQTTGTPPGGLLDNAASANQAPVLAAIGAKSVNENQPLTFTATATDPNGNALTFSAGNLPSGATLSPAGAFSWTPSFSQGGSNYNVTITVTDNGSPAASDSEVVTITVGNVNRPPVLSAIGNRPATEGQLLTFTATATDPDGNAVTFSGSNLPTGATVSPSGTFSWTPSLTQAGSFPNVTITATDNGSPVLTASQSFTITVGNVNRPPVLAPIGARTATVGQLFTFTATATDPDGNAVTFSGGNLPAGATLTPAGVFSWTPTATGNSSVTVTVTDNGTPAQTDSETVTITVSNVTTVNRPPVLASIGAKTVNEGQPLTFTATATDPDGGPLTFSGGILPSGPALTPAGAFSWTPDFTQAGTHNVTITVTDNGGLTDSETFTITVGNVNRPPVLSPSPIGNRTVTIGQTLTIAITASDPDGGALSFTSANLPSGATLTPATPAGTGAATFSWTPATAQAGTYQNVTITVSDGALSDAEVFTITVNIVAVNQPPVLTNPGNKTGTAGQVLSFTITASDPDAGQTLRFAATSTLPSGASLSSTGAFAWTPTTAQASTTAYSVTVTATDNGSPALTSAPVTFTIRVNAPAASPLTLTSVTANQASTQPGGSITATATATGGVAPYQYKWWLWNGNAWSLLQDWTPSNTYTWTPSTAGSYQLGVWVKNGNAVGDGGAVYGARPVTIAPATVSLAASPGGAQAVGTPITVTATATGVTSPTYRFWLWDGHTWSVIREWGSNTVTWTPSVANPQTQLGVWVKPSSAAGDVWAAYGARPVPIAPATVSLAASPGGAQAVGTPITVTATATGVTSPTYRFWLWDGHTWSVIREWGSNTVTWTPSVANPQTQLGVWVKPSSAAGDVWAAYGARPVPIAPATSRPRHRDNDD